MMQPDERFFSFIKEHAEDDTSALLLSASKFKGIDVRLAASTIEGRRKMAVKVPEWGERFDIIYPSSVNVEQCSSSYTAELKQRYFRDSRVFDLTGGLGVDSYYISKVAQSVKMFEQNSVLCSAAKNNFSRLGAENIEVFNKRVDKIEDIDGFTSGTNFSVYIDPSRRSESGGRIFAIRDYDPDIVAMKDSLFLHASRVIVKVSPMADITSLAKVLPECSEIAVISVFNECKELLLILDREMVKNPLKTAEIPITAWNLKRSGKIWESFSWTVKEESESFTELGEPEKGMYLYEPNASILKGGAYKTAGARFGLIKAETSSHLYFGRERVNSFPGRVFRITDICEFGKSGIKHISKTYPKANVSVRNFPLSSAKLLERLKIEEGGETYIFGTLLPHNLRKLIVCKKD